MPSKAKGKYLRKAGRERRAWAEVVRAMQVVTPTNTISLALVEARDRAASHR